ncbi:hypothetical protein LAUMK13_03253 [Mycobacterium innocens]|uniref:Uncharacterized protein n=1 Tax=Mycobacterium innocens TaxID=2341083 RepID=A0A498Q8U4_9MYCO|nr:hypothetical protein LAUMK13_03253 [Mycobacterium innocens]
MSRISRCIPGNSSARVVTVLCESRCLALRHSIRSRFNEPMAAVPDGSNEPVAGISDIT